MKALYTIISAVLALALAVCTALIVYFNSGTAYLIIYILLSLIFFPLTGYLHELGHVIFGAASGMKITIMRTNMFASSSCVVRPKRGGNIKKRYVVTCLGGLIVNLLLILFGVIVLCVPAINSAFSFTAPASLYLFVLNVIPAEYASGKTDMLAIKEAAKSEPTAQVLLTVLQIQGEVAEGKPLKDIEEERLLNVPQLPDDDYNFAMLTALRWQYYEEKGEKQTADFYYRRLRDLGYADKDFK